MTERAPRFRLSLTTLLLLVALASIGSAVLARYLRALERESRAVATLDARGFPAGRRNRPLGWLYDIYADQLGQEAVVLQLDDSPVQDGDLEEIAKVKHLRGLYLNRTAVTDTGMQHLCELPNLIHLVARRTAIETSPNIDSLPSLQKLDLSFTRITNISISRDHPLETLMLRATPINDITIEKLPALPKLTTLDIAGAPGETNAITDMALSCLSPERFPQLNTVFLYDTMVTADGVAHLKSRFPQITVYR